MLVQNGHGHLDESKMCSFFINQGFMNKTPMSGHQRLCPLRVHRGEPSLTGAVQLACAPRPP